MLNIQWKPHKTIQWAMYEEQLTDGNWLALFKRPADYMLGKPSYSVLLCRQNFSICSFPADRLMHWYELDELSFVCVVHEMRSKHGVLEQA